MTQPYPHTVMAQQMKHRPSLGEGFFGLAKVVQALLGLSFLLQVVLILVDVYYLRYASRLVDTPELLRFEDRERFLDVVLLSTSADLGLLLLTGTAFIAWLYQAHRSDRMDPRFLEHKSFWAIIGWFVPIMALFRPYQIVQDVRRGAGSSVVPAAQIYWWAAFLLTVVGDLLVGGLWPGGEEAGSRAFGEALHTAAWGEITVGVIDLFGAVFAILVVRNITSILRTAPDQTSVRPS